MATTDLPFSSSVSAKIFSPTRKSGILQVIVSLVSGRDGQTLRIFAKVPSVAALCSRHFGQAQREPESRVLLRQQRPGSRRGLPAGVTFMLVASDSLEGSDSKDERVLAD